MADSYKQYIPPIGQHPRLGPVNTPQYDAHSFVDEFGMTKQLIVDLWSGWQQLYAEPFRGVTTDGQVVLDLYKLRNEGAPTEHMVKEARHLLTISNQLGLSEKLRYPVDTDEWRRWANPEFYFHRTGIRLEEHPEEIRTAVLRVVRASLSARGYEDVVAAMRTNEFLGSLIGGPKLMNEYSYNFILFGEPSTTEPWGWSMWGHHLAFCVFILGGQMVVSPVFRGCEPNVVDEGPHKDEGIEMFAEEMRLSTQLMSVLTEAERREVILYDRLEHPDMPPGMPHPADGRLLCGAYQDNKVIPPSGGRVSLLSQPAQDAFFELVSRFIDFLPEGPLVAKMADVRKHLDDTRFMWMGGYGENDAFHVQILSPVLLCEFDHECGMWLTNDHPGRFHAHSIVRTPNGNDYGKRLLHLWKQKGSAS